jgi:hypothetical protein
LERVSNGTPGSGNDLYPTALSSKSQGISSVSPDYM